MLKQKITNLLKKGENYNIEFKECKREINKNIYETVCAFLNRSGGELLLGVNNIGKITGIDKDRIEQIKTNFVTAINNPQKISPSVYLTIEEVEIDEKSILYIYVPESSQVHRCSGKIYDRNEDGDLNITDNTNLVSSLYIRKQTNFSENTVFPFVTMAELRSDLIQHCRKIAVIQRQNHPWVSMTDEELIKSARLFQKDWQTGKEGFTLAAILLLLGKDDVILSVVPHHRTDAILRRVNRDRYDDRDFITTNLIESYERLMAFAEKHLPDPFYMEGDQRISIRSHIFREIIVNSLIHREYLNHFPAKFVIERDKVFFENANKPHGFGIINITDFTPFPKNPVISSFFRQIHYAEELGSGFKKIAKYAKAYFGSEPVIQEKDIFRFEAQFGTEMLEILNNSSTISTPINRDNESVNATDQGTDQATDQGADQAERLRMVLIFCKKPRSREDIQKYLKMKHRDNFKKQILQPLLKSELLKLTIPDKPSSPNQKYITVDKEQNQ